MSDADLGCLHLFQRLYQDRLSQVRAEGQAGVTYQANDVRGTGQQANDLLFPKPNFAQALAHLRRRTELFDPYSSALSDAIQRANRTPIFSSPPCERGVNSVHSMLKQWTQISGSTTRFLPIARHELAPFWHKRLRLKRNSV